MPGVFEELVASGATLVLTSNRHPDQMTNHGLHEDIFGKAEVNQQLPRHFVAWHVLCFDR